MASRVPPADMRVFETGAEPEYFITHMRTELAGNGNVRVFAYALRRKTELHLLYTVIIPGEALTVMGRQCLQAGPEAHNLSMWNADTEAH